MLPKLSLPTISVPKELQSSLKRVLDGKTEHQLHIDRYSRSTRRPPEEEAGCGRARVVQVPHLPQDGDSRPGEQAEERTPQNGPWYIQKPFLPLPPCSPSLSYVSAVLYTAVKLWSEKKNSSSKETVESVLRYIYLHSRDRRVCVFVSQPSE